MKKIQKLLAWMTISTALFSCEAEDTQVYSCDPTMNRWAHQNLTDIRTMDRRDWIKLDEDHKSAAYVAFTQEQRTDLWLGKIEQMLKLDWTTEELEHIFLLRDFIVSHQNWFNDEILNEEQENELLLFAYQWVEYGKNELGWNDTLPYAIITTPNDLMDKEGNVEYIYNRKRTLSRSEATSKKKCNCHRTIDTCGLQGGTCDQANCEEVKSFFILNMLTCNGRCSGVLY